jgi:predicted dehydrogenase
MIKKTLNSSSRRRFISLAGTGIASLALTPDITFASGVIPYIHGNGKTPDQDTPEVWKPVSDRKIRVGLVGYGVSKFSAAFSFQNHPNVEIVAVSDLFPDRCAKLAEVVKCKKTYPSLEELVKDDKIEAVFVATDAPSHPKHCIEVLNHGKHVASAVPASFGSLEDADKLFETVRKTGLKYMMFETSSFHEDLHAMRQIYNSGGFGKLVYSEGEYFHYSAEQIDSYKGWRIGGPPQWYPTHSNAYYNAVTNGSFTEVSCLGMPSWIESFKEGNNQWKNPFATEIALFRTSEGGMARMAVSWDTPGDSGERGRIRGQKGSFYGKYEGLVKDIPDYKKPPLPPGVDPGGHGGAHGYLMNEFVMSILEDRKPLVDITMALNLTVSGIVAHQSALKGGEWMKIPQYKL